MTAPLNGMSKKLDEALAAAERKRLAEEDRAVGLKFEAWFMRLAGICAGCSSAEELELRTEAFCLGEWTGPCPDVDASSFEDPDFSARAYPGVRYRFFSKDVVRRIRHVFFEFIAVVSGFGPARGECLMPAQLKALMEWMSRRPALGPFVRSVAGMYRIRMRSLAISSIQLPAAVAADMAGIFAAAGGKNSA